MKNIILLIIFVFGIYNFLISQAATYVNGTIKQDGSNCVAVYAKPNGTVTWPPSNYVFSISIPNVSPYPTLTVTELLNGMVVDANNPPPYNASGRRYYDFNMTQDGEPPVVNWTSGSEYKIGKVCFANGGPDQLIQINDLANEGNNGFTVWYIAFQGPGDLTPTSDKYYESPGQSTVSNGTNSYAQTIAQVALPVQLVTFKVEPFGFYTSVLTWISSFEQNSDYYEIERSQDLRFWESIGTVKAKGDSKSKVSYEYIDNNITLSRSKDNIYYYRLRMVDRDGQFTYSEIRNVDFGRLKTPDLIIHPNPTKDILNLDLSGLNMNKGEISIIIIDELGRSVLTRKNADNTLQTIDIRDLPAGNYIVTVRQNEDVYFNKVVIGD